MAEEKRRSADRVLEPFDERVERIRIPATYRIAIVFVALVMLLLPAVYTGLIALVVRGIYWHATENATIFEETSGRLAALVYLGPLAVGIVLVFFMVKPFFARRPKTRNPIALDPADQPLLSRFVERLCASMGAPAPSEIRIDHQVNASASFRRGVWSFASRDLVLTIGLPLAGGLSLRELTGVLAHEFGHFAQGAGMRLTYVIRTVNAWFHRVVRPPSSSNAPLRRETSAPS